MSVLAGDARASDAARAIEDCLKRRSLFTQSCLSSAMPAILNHISSFTSFMPRGAIERENARIGSGDTERLFIEA